MPGPRVLHSCSSEQWCKFKHHLGRIFNTSRCLSFFQSLSLLHYAISFVRSFMLSWSFTLHSCFGIIIVTTFSVFIFPYHLSSGLFVCPLFYSHLLDWSCNKRWLHSSGIFHLNIQPVNKTVELTLWSLGCSLFSIKQNKVKHGRFPQVSLRALSSARTLLINSSGWVFYMFCNHNSCFALFSYSGLILLCCPHII